MKFFILSTFDEHEKKNFHLGSEPDLENSFLKALPKVASDHAYQKLKI